ncbi:pentatricopeptide repeat-containing protein At2g02980, chloroplastic [Phalaenopsis equestris]|uniref:pentatricopeptide repeat-containing protein At2g02980, chloroplastic n=1 Tax=Phalaenopsis equestris TaxID=78828 RepID=UPI0009E39435|nr:pentatricopeptide repeat-containing protein At2g02980, chloroplastic [Phalaenopsis equestris]
MASLSSPSIFPKSQEIFSPPPLTFLPKRSSFREIQQLHASAIKLRRLNNSFLFNLIDSLSLNPTPASMHYAHKLFDQIPHRDAVIFNTLSRGYSRSHDPHQAIVLFCEMLMASIPPDSYSFPSLLKACASTHALPQGRQAHAAAIKLGFALNAFVLPSLISMYSQCGDVEAARTIFDKGTDRCVISFNSMITAFVQSSRPGEALALFREMQTRQLRPTYVTVLGVLAACALIGAIHLGKWIHEYAEKNGFSSCVKVNTALIDMYGKCGSLEDAIAVFEGMEFRDAQAWSAMIIAHAIHGQGSEALKLFDEMRRMGISPDGITFIGILYSCSHSGMVEQGLRYFRDMSNDYGIVPGIKHYGCIVDLLARTGRLEEAYDFINGLPIKPTPILWRTLLSACGSHGNVELGKKVFDRIIELDDSHGGDYVILSNLCALNRMWEDVNEIRKMMSERGVAKVPGCSSIEVDSKVHEFFAGDGKHPDSNEVRRMVDEVMEELKAVGYVPDTGKVRHVDLTEEEKEESLRYHSEKLAIAFGLMKTPPGTTIRVVKNLRICSDCHAMAKLVSMVFGRKIILRDLNRFHHFAGGHCSCADYW